MEGKIREAIENLFKGAPETAEAQDLMEEMISNAIEKYKDLCEKGFNEEQAYTMVMASIGDVEELLADLAEQAKEDGGEDKHSEYWEKSAEYIEKSAEYLKFQGEFLEKQARNLGNQAVSAVEAIMGSGIWENIASSVKQIIGGVGMTVQSERGEYSDMALRNERKFSQDGIRELVVELTSSPVDLEVAITDGTEIIVQEYYNKEPEKDQLLEYSVVGSELKMQYGVAVLGLHRRGLVKILIPDSLVDELKEFRAVTTSGDVTIDTLGAAKQFIRTMSGDVKAVAAKGELTISTASGDVKFDVAEGPIQVRTASGDIKIASATGDVTANTASGDIEIDSLAGNGVFHTASGDVEVGVAEVGEKLEAVTASGDVDVTLPGEASVQMTLKTASGDIVTFCDCITGENINYVKHGKNAVGTVGTDPFLQLKVTTASGDIKIAR